MTSGNTPCTLPSMHAYILRRLLLIIPTLFGIMVLNFAIIQAAPGGPVEQAIAKIKGTATGAASRIGGGGAGGDLGMAGQQAAMGKLQTRAADSAYRGAQGLDPDFIKELEKQYGFDKPALTRFWQMLGDYVTLDVGDSTYRDVPVLALI